MKTARPAEQTGHWSWEGGTPVTVGADETVETIGRRYGVPASAIMQANGLQKATDIRSGQRLVIPRYISAATPQPAPVASKPAPVAVAKPAQPAPPKESVYTVASGDTLIGIARKYDVALPELAKANNVAPNHRVTPGDRIMVPGGHSIEFRQASTPKIEKPQTAPSDGGEHPGRNAPTSRRLSPPRRRRQPRPRSRPARCRPSVGRCMAA